MFATTTGIPVLEVPQIVSEHAQSIGVEDFFIVQTPTTLSAVVTVTPRSSGLPTTTIIAIVVSVAGVAIIAAVVGSVIAWNKHQKTLKRLEYRGVENQNGSSYQTMDKN